MNLSKIIDESVKTVINDVNVDDAVDTLKKAVKSAKGKFENSATDDVASKLGYISKGKAALGAGGAGAAGIAAGLGAVALAKKLRQKKKAAAKA